VSKAGIRPAYSSPKIGEPVPTMNITNDSIDLTTKVLNVGDYNMPVNPAQRAIFRKHGQ
jgi:hypothetical protein